MATLKLTNKLHGTSIIRVVDSGSANIAIANLAYDGNETVASSNIKKVTWSSNGYITVVRNSEKVLDLAGSGSMYLDELNTSLAANNTSNYIVTIVTGGSLIMEVTKSASYASSLTGI